MKTVKTMCPTVYHQNGFVASNIYIYIYIYIYNKFQNQKDLQNKSIDWFLYDGNFDV